MAEAFFFGAGADDELLEVLYACTAFAILVAALNSPLSKAFLILACSPAFHKSSVISFLVLGACTPASLTSFNSLEPSPTLDKVLVALSLVLTGFCKEPKRVSNGYLNLC